MSTNSWVHSLDRFSPWREPLSRLSDGLVLATALISAAYLWNRREPGAAGDPFTLQQWPASIGWLLLWLGLALVGLHLTSVYHSTRTTTLMSDLYGVISALSIASVLTLSIGYLVGDRSSARFFFVLVWMLSAIGLTVSRGIARLLLARLRREGVGRGRLVIVGGGPRAHRLAELLGADRSLGYDVVGYVAAEVDADWEHAELLGHPNEIEELIERHHIHEIIIIGNVLPHSRIIHLTRLCQRLPRRVALKLMPDTFEEALTQVSLEQLKGHPLVCLTETHRPFGDMAKRGLDLVIAGWSVLLLAPLFLVIALLIRRDSPGPIIFRQTRVGRHGQEFTFFKFRSMYIDAEAQLERLRQFNEVSGPIFKMKDDPRVTRIGRWLRRTSLDELPQLINVIKGDMSLVGPRPAVPSEVRQYTEYQLARLDTTPGITGLWQVSGRSQLGFEDMVKLDIDYIQSRSFWLDLKILIRTIPAVLSRHGAF